MFGRADNCHTTGPADEGRAACVAARVRFRFMKRVGLKTLIILLLARAPFAQAVDAKPQASWHIEVVEKSAAAGGGLFSSLAIDTSGNLHLVYSNRSGKELRYAFRRKQDSRWDTATVDSLGGWFSSMAVDSQGHSHIAYNSPRLPGLYYATWDGTKWQKILIDPSKTGHQTSIQLDSQGNPRIAYYREEYSGRGIAKDLKYAYFDGKSWYIQTVDHRAGTGKWNSIALDQAGDLVLLVPYRRFLRGGAGHRQRQNRANHEQLSFSGHCPS